MQKQNLVLNNEQWLISHKTKPNQTKPKNEIMLKNKHLFGNVIFSSFLIITIHCFLLDYMLNLKCM